MQKKAQKNRQKYRKNVKNAKKPGENLEKYQKFVKNLEK